MGVEFDHTVVQWVTVITSVLFLLGGLLGAVFAFYRYFRRDIELRINERFEEMQKHLESHILESEKVLNALTSKLEAVEAENKEIVNNYKAEFKKTHEQQARLEQLVTAQFGEIKADVAVLSTKIDLFFSTIKRNEDK